MNKTILDDFDAAIEASERLGRSLCMAEFGCDSQTDFIFIRTFSRIVAERRKAILDNLNENTHTPI